jgi:two-component system sensor histidine kinase PilS (NtrC family)
MITETNHATWPGQQNAILIRVYSWYRLLLAAVLYAMLISSGQNPIVGRAEPELFAWLCGGYFLFAALLLIVLPSKRQPTRQQLFLNFFIDIAVLIALSHVSGAIAGGIALLLLVAVAASGLMLTGQIALLVAALATIALLADTLYLIEAGRVSNQSLVPAGMLGMLFFATSLGFQHLSQRLRTTQLLAQQRAADVSKLQNLNQLIVQRMRTGILVVDSNHRIKMINSAAVELLQADALQRQLETGTRPRLEGNLQQRLLQWKEHPDAGNTPFMALDSGPELIARFTSLDHEKSADTLIFLEDHGQLAQRAQQLKLAALGRFTASIAHEIRNPLGAVSHAAQLLQESPSLADDDLRLAHIILNHSRRMNTIIESILQLSRRSPPNPRRLDLGAWLHDYVREYRQGCNIDAADIGIRELKALQITVDPDQFSQVLTNLLDNALRYSLKTNGRATAELVIGTAPNQLPQLDVIDDGIGIPRHEQERVFEPFFTTDNKGNGLGLYICRELCEINQARLSYLRNNQGKSCFRISFSHPDRKPLINE